MPAGHIDAQNSSGVSLKRLCGRQHQAEQFSARNRREMQLALHQRFDAECELCEEGQTHCQGDGEAERSYPSIYVF